MVLVSNQTNRKLLFLIFVIIIGFVSLFSLNKLFTNLINDLDKKVINLQSRTTIGEFIAYDIIKLRSLFNEFATTTSSKRSRELIKEDIQKSINLINQSIFTLENGGTLERKIALNIAGHLVTTKKVNYSVTSTERYSLEVIDIKPKLEDIKKMSLEIEKMLIVRNESKRDNDLNEFIKNAKDIRRYYKSLPAFFNRMSENIRRLLYESELELNELRNKTEQDKEKFLTYKLTLIIFVITIVLLIGFTIIKRVNKDSKELQKLNIDLQKNLREQEKQKKSIKAILDAQPNIIIVSDGKNIKDANKQLFEFFDQYSTLDEFKNINECICKFFEDDIPDDTYIKNQTYDNVSWAEYILKNSDKHFKVIMKKNGINHHFSIQITQTLLDTNEDDLYIIITFNDITEEINYQKNLETIVENKTKELQKLNGNLALKVKEALQKSRNKDKILHEQSKMAALGEMIGNIAHQWRQPLSIISTASTGMIMQKKFNTLDDDAIESNCDIINKNAQYLSQTIDDFKNFIKGDKEKAPFNLSENITTFLHLVEGTKKSNNIYLELHLQDNIIINGYQNELLQCFINIFNNAKDALSQREENRYIFISTKFDDEKAEIIFRDNAGGIPEDIIGKIFEPYFTTKHKSQGTGLGLHMTYNLVVNGMNGLIKVDNVDFEFKGESYTGAEFVITLPLT